MKILAVILCNQKVYVLLVACFFAYFLMQMWSCYLFRVTVGSCKPTNSILSH